MLLYLALQAAPTRRQTLLPPILAATAPLAHAAVSSARPFRPSAVEAATATSTTSATKTTSRFIQNPPRLGHNGRSTNFASDSTSLPCGLQRTAPARRSEASTSGRRSSYSRSRSHALARLGQRPSRLSTD